MKQFFTNTNLLLLTVCCLFLSYNFTNAQCHIDDWTALKALYESTDGDNWNNNDGWQIIKNETPTVDCELENLWGIGVNANGRINTLVLNNNNIIGKIPSTLGKLSRLINLVLYNNKLSGNIPSELGNLTSLKELHLAGNQLSGNIPSELGNLTAMEELHLEDNQLSGNIPSELGSLIALECLDLSNNQLSGSMPSDFSNLIHMTQFYVQNNQLSGIIPNNIGINNDFSIIIFVYGNFYSCSELQKFDNENLYVSAFVYSSQDYKHNADKLFLINSSEESVLLSAPFGNSGNYTYQWDKNGTIIEGATDSILHLNNVQFEDVGYYRLSISDPTCIFGILHTSEPISVRRTDLEGCTDIKACNYNEFAFIDDGSCEYFWCDTLSNPIKIRTTNEVILSDTTIKFDLVIDSLGLDYSADGLSFTLDTKGNYDIVGIEVINPILSAEEVIFNKLYKNPIIIFNRMNTQRLASGKPILRAVICLPVDDVPTDEANCSHFLIHGGTELTNGYFVDFDNIYIDIPFSDCTPFGNIGAEGNNWLPLVLTVSPQNCNTDVLGIAEIKILQEGQSPFSYTLKNEKNEIILKANDNLNKLIELTGMQANNYELTVSDKSGNKTSLITSVPLINSLYGNEVCNTNCVSYVTVPNGEITGTHYAQKEIEIKGFVRKTETVEFEICK